MGILAHHFKNGDWLFIDVTIHLRMGQDGGAFNEVDVALGRSAVVSNGRDGR